MVEEQRRRYTSYLLRLWQAESQGELVWRASLESPHSGQRWSFARLEELHTFLDQVTGPAEAGGEPDEQA